MDFRKDAPLFFDSRTRPRPVSVEVSEIRFAKPPCYHPMDPDARKPVFIRTAFPWPRRLCGVLLLPSASYLAKLHTYILHTCLAAHKTSSTPFIPVCRIQASTEVYVRTKQKQQKKNSNDSLHESFSSSFFLQECSSMWFSYTVAGLVHGKSALFDSTKRIFL